MPTPTVTLCNGQTVKLGRIRPVAAFDYGHFRVVDRPDGTRKVMPRLSAFYNAAHDAVPPPPATNWRAKGAAALAQTLGNTTQGDCVIASKLHQVGIWTGNATGTPAVSNDSEALAQYHQICGGGDNGCVITNVLDWFKANGLTVGGTTHKIDNYVAIDWTNQNLVQVAIEVFGTGCIGINLPSAWTCTNCVWSPTNTGIVGGHDVPFIDYDPQYVYIATWGGVVQVTWAAFLSQNWIDEAYIELSPDWYANANLAPNGINVAGLQTAFAAIASGQVPVIPIPTPTPTPTPNPTPTPTPTPTPVPPPPPPPPPPSPTTVVVVVNGTTVTVDSANKLITAPGYSIAAGR